MKRFYEIKQLIEQFRVLRRIYHNIADVTIVDELHKGTAAIVGYLTDIKEMIIELDEHNHSVSHTCSSDCSSNDDQRSDLIHDKSSDEDYCIYKKEENSNTTEIDDGILNLLEDKGLLGGFDNFPL